MTDAKRTFDVLALTACLVVLLAPISRVLAVIDGRQGPDYAQHTILFAVDVALAVLVVQRAPALVILVRRWRSHAASLAAVILAFALIPGLIANPGDRGVAAILRLVGVALLASLVPDLGVPERRALLGAVAVVLAVSGSFALYQRATGGPLGLPSFGESSEGVLSIGGGTAPFGLFVHPYVMAAWATVLGLGLVAIRLEDRDGERSAGLPAPLLLLGAAPIALSMCRSAVVGVALASVPLAVLVFRARSRLRDLLVFGLVAGAVALGAAWNIGGWLNRATSTVGSDPTTLRGSLNDQAFGLLRQDPVLGVGPGNYVLALRERPDLVALNPQTPRPVHNTPLLLVVEGGLFVGPALALCVLAIGWQALRAGPVGWVLVGAFAPFLLFDHLAWSFPQGLVLTGLWMGLLDLAAKERCALKNCAGPVQTVGDLLPPTPTSG